MTLAPTEAELRAHAPVQHVLSANDVCIDELVILVGPSGSGKTTIAKRIVRADPAMPVQVDSSECLRTDARSIRANRFSGGAIIVEYATSAFLNRRDYAQRVADLTALISKARRARIVTCRIGRSEAARRYRTRMKHETLRRTPETLRYLRIDKWRKYLRYLIGREIPAGYAAWARVEAALRELFEERRDVSFHELELEQLDLPPEVQSSLRDGLD
ncbi:MAG: hypothetical protein AAFQ45_04185 [Pseudomonadota bacterium]